MNGLKDKGHKIRIVVRKKDILEDLLRQDGLEYVNILPKGRRDNIAAILWAVLKKDVSLYRIARDWEPDLMVGTSVEITHIGKLLRIPSIVVNEDDFDVVPHFSRLAYPFANCILAPSSCRVGKWRPKAVQYNGYHELNYLHPKYFRPEKDVVERFHRSHRRYFILRFAKLAAHHDFGKTGINKDVAKELIAILEPHGTVYITSERELEPCFEKYRIDIDSLDIHHALFFADLYVGDSQTMAAEAAVLGTPSVRFNDFVGKIGYLEELEHSYGLTYGIRTSDLDGMFKIIKDLSELSDLKRRWAEKRDKMLAEKISSTDFMVWFLEKYPESFGQMKADPSYQYNFR
jgi:predicted glycosyltransferase